MVSYQGLPMGQDQGFQNVLDATSVSGMWDSHHDSTVEACVLALEKKSARSRVGNLNDERAWHSMAQRCKYSGAENGSLCSCPHFVPKESIGINEATTCAGCLHTIAWHRIPSSTPPAQSPNTNKSFQDLLSTFTAQAAAVGGSVKTRMKGKCHASEDDARRKAIAGLKKTAMSENEGSSKKMSQLKGGTRRSVGKQKRGNSGDVFTSVRLLVIMPEGIDDTKTLNETTEPNLQRINQLSEATFAIFRNPGELEFSNQWSTRKLDEWLRQMLPADFEPMDDVAEVGDEFTWRLLKASRSGLSLHREVPDGYDFVDAKGVSQKWLSSIIHELKGKDALTSKHSAYTIVEAELDDEPIHSHNTRSKKKRTSISPVP
ncbi:hypothetical protein JB92DRAFT_2833199 [Gautieria morchelliformis]|nr:hypothetical protein JB92DRAFT_2833199 [Gautieria morchelliformis]